MFDFLEYLQPEHLNDMNDSLRLGFLERETLQRIEQLVDIIALTPITEKIVSRI